MDREAIISDLVSMFEEREEEALRERMEQIRHGYREKIAELRKVYIDLDIQFSFTRHTIDLPLKIREIPFEESLKISIKRTHIRDDKILVCVRYPEGDSFKEIDVGTGAIEDSSLTHENYMFGKLVKLNYEGPIEETETHIFKNEYALYRDENGTLKSVGDLREYSSFFLRTGSKPLISTLNPFDVISIHDISARKEINFFGRKNVRRLFMFRGRYYMRGFIYKDDIMSNIEGGSIPGMFYTIDCETGHWEHSFDFISSDVEIYTGYDCIYYLEGDTVHIVQ